MKITKIEQQKKDKHRYNIYLDDEFAFGLYEESIIDFGLRKGVELDENKINEIRIYDEYNFARKVAFRFLSYRQRSVSEIIKRLKKEEISEGTIDKVINYLKDLKFLDDEKFSKLLIESKTRKRPIGRRLLTMKLMEKGVEKEIIDKSITENYSDEQEIEAAKRVLEKYLKKVKAENDFEKRKKCFQHLLMRGFNFDTANEAIRTSGIFNKWNTDKTDLADFH